MSNCRVFLNCRALCGMALFGDVSTPFIVRIGCPGFGHVQDKCPIFGHAVYFCFPFDICVCL